MNIGEIEARFLTALLEAEDKHPGWPRDVIHAAAIAFEEKGELLKAAIDFNFGRGSREELIKEASQLGAMAMRFLMHVEDYQPTEEEEAEPKEREERIKYLRKKYNMEPLENRMAEISKFQNGSVQITGLNPEDKKKPEQPKICGECIHFEGNDQKNYCPFKMTATEAESEGCGEGELKPW